MSDVPFAPKTAGQQGEWFTEAYDRFGSSFGLAVEQHVTAVTTPYQRIDIYETKYWGYLMTIDGCTMVSTKDNFFYHEMMSHMALYSHPNPQTVVVIGGGDCGTLQQVLRHESVTTAIQIEIDEQVTILSEKYFPELTKDNADSRAQLTFEDGIAWMQRRESNSVDVIIVDSTDPMGPAEGLFNEAFYRECHRVLNDTGVFVQQSESPLFEKALIESMHAAYQSAGFKKTATFGFPQPIYPSGFWSGTLAFKTDLVPAPRTPEVMPFETQYYTKATHVAALTLPMVQAFNHA